MEPLDGNAIAGELFEYFGADMTTARGSCGHCGSTAQIGELVVYSRAPGSVVRCPTCGNVVLALVTLREGLRIDSEHFTLLESA
jgi:ribosomal protein S27AE